MLFERIGEVVAILSIMLNLIDDLFVILSFKMFYLLTFRLFICIISKKSNTNYTEGVCYGEFP